MAILNAENSKKQSRILITGLPPKGGYVATCIDIEDEYNVVRPRFDDPTTTETVNLTSFYFGIKIKTGEAFVIRSKRMKISLHEKSALYGFLAAWLGEPPKPGMDTAMLVGAGGQISITHTQSQKSAQMFANIGTISPVMEDLKSKILPIKSFDGCLAPQIAGASIDPETDEIPF